MNIKHIILVALAALALGLASIGVAAPSIAGGKVVGSDFQADKAAPRITVDGGLSGGVVEHH